MTCEQWLNELVPYGNEDKPRGEIIEDLYRVAKEWTDDPDEQRKLVGLYLAGQERLRPWGSA